MGADLQVFQGSVRRFVRHQLNELRESLSDVELDESTMKGIERRLDEKSDGMFCQLLVL
jgi:predicted ATP-dependent endonuclease of OLD family